MTSQTAQLSKTLKKAIGTLGVTQTEVERRLGLSRGYLSRLFAGEIDLKIDHVVRIGEVLGVEPEELLRLAFPAPKSEPSKEALRLREAFGVTAQEAEPQAAPSGLEREIEEIVKRAMAKTFAKLQP
jgi:transcriptional regulator with XRE-family HTH domain